MQRCVAFLRSINVGGHTVKMADLKRRFERMGFARVETFIASGNVLFDTDDRDLTDVECRIEAILRSWLDYDVATFVRPITALAAIVAHDPFTEPHAPESIYIGFLKAAPAKAVQATLLALQTPTDRFAFHGSELHWQITGRSSDSMFSGTLLEKTLCMPATVRRSTTVRKLAAKA